MSAKKIKKSKNKITGSIILLLIALIIAFILFKVISLIAIPSDIVVVENGIITSEESAIGYVIRDEKIANESNLEKEIYQLKGEGEKVARGEDIFRYYSTAEDTINDKINELNGQIQEAMLRTNRFILSRY